MKTKHRRAPTAAKPPAAEPPPANDTTRAPAADPPADDGVLCAPLWDGDPDGPRIPLEQLQCTEVYRIVSGEGRATLAFTLELPPEARQRDVATRRGGGRYLLKAYNLQGFCPKGWTRVLPVDGPAIAPTQPAAPPAPSAGTAQPVGSLPLVTIPGLSPDANRHWIDQQAAIKEADARHEKERERMDRAHDQQMKTLAVIMAGVNAKPVDDSGVIRELRTTLQNERDENARLRKENLALHDKVRELAIDLNAAENRDGEDTSPLAFIKSLLTDGDPEMISMVMDVFKAKRAAPGKAKGIKAAVTNGTES